MLKALIFDVDGTLAETEEAHRRAFNDTFRDEGLRWYWDQRLYGELLKVAGGKERIHHFIDRFHPALLSEPDLVERIARLHRAKTDRYLSLIASGEVPLRPGVRTLIDEARAAGRALAIATTTSRPNVAGLLDATIGREAITWFAAIGAGEDAGAKKPAPEIYRLVLERLGLTGADCLAFEDSANGLRSAR
ncbi:MAG: HAD-IA family hydrolase, partial [Alphaproteobacteria bacterium]|nr:HAD-IA family hydrolase [Alphaproteobacteria bacterium]